MNFGRTARIGTFERFLEMEWRLRDAIAKYRAEQNRRAGTPDRAIRKDKDPHFLGATGELLLFKMFGVYPFDYLDPRNRSAANGEDAHGDGKLGDFYLDVKGRMHQDLLVDAKKADSAHPPIYALVMIGDDFNCGTLKGFYPADLLFVPGRRKKEINGYELRDWNYIAYEGELMEWEQVVKHCRETR